jgi:hypothetical protein
MVAHVDADGRAYLRLTQYETRFVLEKREVKVGDKVEEQTLKVPVTVAREVRLPLDAKGVRVMTAGGKRVEPKDLRAMLKKTSAVLVSADGKDVDPLYLRLARPDALVVISPQAARHAEMPLPIPPVPKGGGETPDKKPSPQERCS